MDQNINMNAKAMKLLEENIRVTSMSLDLAIDS